MHGILEIFQLDNAWVSIYASPKIDMIDFATSYGYVQITSSPHYPRSNGFDERSVKTARAMLKKHRSTFSPSQLSFNRTILVWFEPSSVTDRKEDKECTLLKSYSRVVIFEAI